MYIHIDRVHNSYISYFHVQHDCCNFKHCVLRKSVRSRISDICTSKLWDILEIRRSLLVEDIFEPTSFIFSHVEEIRILLFIVNIIIPFILYLMLFSFPFISFSFYQTKFYFWYFYILFLASVIFPITEIGIFVIFSPFHFVQFRISSISFIFLLSTLFTLSFSINRNYIFLSFTFLFRCKSFSFFFFSKYYSYCVIIDEVSRLFSGLELTP